jgi:mRNA interferase RelE/StbE
VNERSYAIAWTSPAKRALKTLPEKAATAAIEFIYGSLSQNPHRVGKRLRFDLEGLHSARRGDYRIIYRINTEQRTIEVVAIEHRSDAYRSS